ncbi:hypothetical protein [Halosimplex pelagicum]|uniref:Uncharacterized protein n=1 Tax=Halosimplex pelagicum TaxID=869886 RepID=A0A7D5TWA6_9EURY|nr:hypothetical protein [Halosimplex pelagicum]QLH84652.1 hypothetical protein HZS54_24740 [Halosimplex pelagicum]
MRSRRTLLAGLGTLGAATLAGCSALPLGDDDSERADVSLPADAVDPLSWPPSPFPVAVPETLATAHEERATELLAAVPDEPTVANGAISEDLRSQRARAADRLDDPVEVPWPTERLSLWRSRREAAAAARGAHRAATGDGDASAVADRRRTVRADLGSFVADHEYRASSPLEAVLVHAPVEDLTAECRRRLRPVPAYPDDPVAAPFRAGEAVGTVERARATLADARGLRDAYLRERDDPPSQWSAVIEASDRLRFAVGRTYSTVDAVVDADEPPVDADLDGTPARTLFEETSRHVRATHDDFEDRRADGDAATAVVEAGRTLAAVESLRTAIDGIRDGAYRESVTVESVTRTAERARAAIAAVDDSDHRRLATRIARPALETFDFVPTRIEDGYTDAARVQGDLARVELYARAVPAATAFVTERLD